jgi:two-component system osmolarity sensor histidine kinase EnvZ
MLIVGQLFFSNHWSQVQRNLSRGLAGEIGTILKLHDSNPELANRMAADIGINISVNEKLNRPAVSDNRKKEAGHLAEELQRRLLITPKIYIERSKRLLFIDVKKDDKIVTFATTLRRVYSSSAELFVIFIIGAVLIVSLLTLPFVLMHARSIRRIAAAANRFGRGLNMPEFKPSGSTEIREAGSALVAMKSRLDRYNKTRSDMLNAVSHDLKSPLARMRLMMEAGTADKDKMLGDIDRMAEMVNGYLSFARGEIPEIEQEVSLEPIIVRIVRDSGEAEKIKLNFPPEPAYFYARPNAVSSAFYNVVDNAVRHMKKKVEITEKDADEYVEVTIDDDGCGIPPEQRAEALQPFTRLDQARAKESGGTGLGLSIAQTAIENHGGQLFLEDSPLGGLRVRIVLPI